MKLYLYNFVYYKTLYFRKICNNENKISDKNIEK
jgi:hypothetical protein